MIQDIIGVLSDNILGIFRVVLLGWVSFLACNYGKAIFLFVLSDFGDMHIQGEILK
jgi:hypothetical protein